MPQQFHFRKCKTLSATHQLLHILAMSPKRFCDFTNQLGCVAGICKTNGVAKELLRFNICLFRSALKTTNSENAIPLSRNA